MRPAFRQARVTGPRQLPTDHDYAVSTREYQSDHRRRSPSIATPSHFPNANNHETNIKTE